MALSGKRLGRGLDALIPDKGANDNVASDKVISEKMINDKGEGVLDEEVIKRAVEEGKRNPRVVVWSLKSSIALRILKKSIPEFSISKEASKLLEEAIKRKYPEIWRIVEESI